MPDVDLSRRGVLLAAALLVSLTGCACRTGADDRSLTPQSAPPDLSGRFADLERRYQARLGVCVTAMPPTTLVAHRADERFAWCSTFKAPLVAAVLHRNPLSHLDTVIRDSTSDTGMTVRELCDVAIRYSDGTAANLLLSDLGGPAAFTDYLRSLGDPVSRLDQQEPELNRNRPGDERDTTTPRAIGFDLQRLVLGDALAADKRALLTDWMAHITTGANRIRAGFPADWTVVDKTGTGDYGRANDAAVVWSPSGTPFVVAIMSDRADGGYDAEPREGLIAETASCVANLLT